MSDSDAALLWKLRRDMVLMRIFEEKAGQMYGLRKIGGFCHLYNGQEAVAAVRRGHFDLVLMDVQMPNLDGMDATRAIRALPGWQDVPILAMTANAFAEDRQSCLDAGMNDHIAKPVDPGALIATLRRWLEKDSEAD